MADDLDWSARLARDVGRNVKAIRTSKHPKLSAQALAERTRELGHQIQRAVIANLESGRRGSITLADIYVLARALNVPPLALLAPLTSEHLVEVLPGRFMTAWDAVGWFNGNSNNVSDSVTQEDDGFREWYANTDAYDMRWRYEVEQLRVGETMRDLEGADGDYRDALLGKLESQRHILAEIRRRLQDGLGVVGVPPLAIPSRAAARDGRE